MSLRLSLVIDGNARDAAAAVDQVKGKLGELETRAKAAAGATDQAMARAGQGAANAARLSTQQLAGMQFQLQDIAVGLTSGQSPFTVMMQQGSQMAQSFQSGTGVMAALRAVGGGIQQFLTNPLNIAVLGFGAFATAAGAALSGILSQMPDVNRDIEHHEEVVKRIAEAYKDALARAKEYGMGAPDALQFMGERFQNLFDLEESQNRIRAALQSQVDAFTPQLQLLRSEIGGPLMGGESEAAAAIAAAIDAFMGSAEQGSQELNRLFEDMKRAARDLPGGDFLRDTVNSVISYGKQAEATAKQVDAGQKQLDYLSGKTKTLGTEADKASSAVGGLVGNIAKLSVYNNSRAQIFGSTPIIDRPDNSGLGFVPEQMRSVFVQAAEKFNVSAELLARIAQQESGFNPNARSSAGAMGIMQLMPGTARDMNVPDPFNTSQSIYGGARYIRQMLDLFAGDVEKALAAYNWGPANVEKWVARGADPSRLPDETRNYVKGVLTPLPGIMGQVKADQQDVGQAQRFAEIIRQQADATSLLAEAQGRSAAETARVRAEQKLWSDARRIYGDELRTNATLHGEVEAAIRKESQAAAEAAQRQDEHNRELAAYNRNAAQMVQQQSALFNQFSGFGSGLVSQIAQAREAGESWTKSFAAGLDMLAQKGVSLLDRLIDGLLDAALLGNQQQGGTSGGLLGSFFNLFNPMQNAKGNAFAGGRVTAFAKGGITDGPSFFPMAGGRTGLMGEVPGEAEGILPLKRMASGHLGVRAMGGQGGAPNVNIHNYGGGEVKARTPANGQGGFDIEVFVTETMNRHLAQGGADDILGSRFGLRQQTQGWG